MLPACRRRIWARTPGPLVTELLAPERDGLLPLGVQQRQLRAGLLDPDRGLERGQVARLLLGGLLRRAGLLGRGERADVELLALQGIGAVEIVAARVAADRAVG